VPARFTQVVGERWFYRQPVVDDTIVSAVWSIEPAGPVLDAVQTVPTSSLVRMEGSQSGTYTLTCTAELASGQRAKGQAQVDVIERSV